MKLVLTEFVSLDGVSQGPGSPTEDVSGGFEGGGWLVPFMDEVFVGRAADWLRLAGGLLLGRRTYEAFARDWPRITDPADPFTGLMNSLPKYVVSTSMHEAGWGPVTVLRDLEGVGELKSRPGDELQVHGSARLGGALLNAGLVDVVRLVVAPVVVGSGRRLFEQPGDGAGLKLSSSEATPTGLLLLEYEVVGAAEAGEYEGVSAFV